MVKKFNIVTISLFFAIFIGVFWFSYKNSRKFRESVRIAIIVAILTLGPSNVEAKNNWFSVAGGFMPPVNRNLGSKNSGYFSQQEDQNAGSENPGGGGDDGNPEPPNYNIPPETTPWQCLPEFMYSNQSNTSDTETESSEYSSSDWEEKEFLGRLTVIASDGDEVNLDQAQLRDKAHHLDVFLQIDIPKTFDIKHVKTLDYKSRLEYVGDHTNLPDKTVRQMQMELAKFFRATRTEAFSGTLGRNKIEGTIYINKRTRTVAFINKDNRKCRTVITMSEKQLQRLENRDYHLFPRR